MSKSKKAMFLQEWKEQVGNNMEHFHEGAALMVRKHQSQSQPSHTLLTHSLPLRPALTSAFLSRSPRYVESNMKTTTFASTLHEMSQHELSPSIKAALDSLSHELTSAESARLSLLAQLQAHLVNEFAKYPHKLKVQEVNIRARNKAFEKFVKKQKSFVALKGNARPERQAHAKEVFDHERQRLQGAEATLNTSLAQFETARVKEMQAMLKKYISSQIHFFGRSIEGLSTAYARVCEIDGEREGERLVEEMKKLEQLEQKDDHSNIDTAMQAMHLGQPNTSPMQQQQQPASAGADQSAQAQQQQQQPQQAAYSQSGYGTAPTQQQQVQGGGLQQYPPNTAGVTIGPAVPSPYGTLQQPMSGAFQQPNPAVQQYQPAQSNAVNQSAGYQPQPATGYTNTLPGPAAYTGAPASGYGNAFATTQLPVQQQQPVSGAANGAATATYGYAYGNANKYSGQNLPGGMAGYTLGNVGESKN